MIKKIVFFLMLVSNNISEAKESVNKTKNILWYKEPAASWNSALPLGNGSLGAMVTGGIIQEHIYLNESSMWSGQSYFNENKEMPAKLSEIRDLLFAGNHAAAEALAAKYCTTPLDPRYGAYQPLGDLLINFISLKHPIKNYIRKLNIGDATSEVQFTCGNTTYTRQYFVNAPSNVMVIKLRSNQKKKISFELMIGREKGASLTSQNNQELSLHGENEFGGSQFNCTVKVIPTGGKLISENQKLKVSDADEVVILLTAATNFFSKNPKSICNDLIKNATSRGFNYLLKEHIKDYQYYFNRVDINLGTSKTSSLPTNLRIKKAEEDPDINALFFQYGRYLLISSSRPGGLPANLQGIWNKDYKPAWFSDYTININFQMNYWPAEVTNLSELTAPMFTQIERMYPVGKKSAKERYGVNGWELSIRSNPWGVNELRAQSDLLYQDAAAWLCTHIWEHFLYTKDTAFLKKNYYLIKEAAIFYDEFLIKHPKYDWLVSGPSASPENKFLDSEGNKCAIDMGTTMSNQIIHDIFSLLAKSATVLKLDESFVSKILKKRSQLAPMQIGSKGQLLEWLYEYQEQDPYHRHISHLYGLFPSNQISLLKTPILAQAAKKTLLTRGDGGTGWSKAWKTCFWARLNDGEYAHKMLLETFQESTLPNLLNNHPPFQIDGNFGNTAAIAELLIQSHEEEIVLLPALPSAWKTGSIQGLVARGGFEIDIFWKDNKIQKVNIFPRFDGHCKIRYGQKIINIITKKNKAITLNKEFRQL